MKHCRPHPVVALAAAALVLTAAPGPIRATPMTILLTATPGGGTPGGAGLGNGQFWATRFQAPFDGTARTAGARLMTIFTVGTVEMAAAIVELTGPTDFPDSSNLTTPDVVGSGVFSFTGNGTADRSVSLDLPIEKDQWYALAFGKGLRGASGANTGGTSFSLANTPIGSPRFFVGVGPNEVTSSLRMFLTAEPSAPHAAVGSGTGSSGQVGGGPAVVGGVEATFENVTAGGLLIGDFAATHIADLTPELADSIDFLLLTDPLQMWEIDFTGAFSGQITLTFGYDDTNLLPGMAEEDLGIFHRLDNGTWELLDPVALDTVNNTVSVETASLSTFAIGAVPEPAAMSLLALGGVALIRRRQ